MENNDRKFAVVYNNLFIDFEKEETIDQGKTKDNVLTVLPYDFYENEENDEATSVHNSRMLAKVHGWVDGYKFSINNKKS